MSTAWRKPPAAAVGPCRGIVLLLAVCLAVATGTTARAADSSMESTAEDRFAARPAAPDIADGIMLNFEDASLRVVLEHLSQEAGLAVVDEVGIDGRVTVFSRRPLSVEEAVGLLNTVLKEQGYAAIRTGKTLTIVTLEQAKQRNIPVRTGNDPEHVADSDEMITQVIPIRYADALKMRDDLQPLVSSYAEFSANQSSNSLILTDTAANIRRIMQIVRALDTALSGATDVRVYQLEYADATDAARLINEVFQMEATTNQRQGGRAAMARFFRGRGGPGGDQDQEGEANGPATQSVTASADSRTNTVVVSGPSETLDVVERVIKDLDANPAEEESVFVYAVRNGEAANLAEVVNNLLSSTQTSARGGTTGRSTRGGRQSFLAAMRGGTQTAQQAAAGLAGEVYVVADEDSNTVLVLTAPKNFDTVRSILEELDRPVPQVLIKVLIAEVTHDRTVDLGFEFSILNIAAGSRGTALFTDFGVADQTTGLIFRLVQGDLGAALQALEEIGRLDVLSRPYILTSDNQEATITVGSEVPRVTNSLITEQGSTRNTVTYEDIGIILSVTPHINPEGLVIMDVGPEISSLSGVTVPISDTLEAPVIAKRSAATHVAIRDGQTIVIGGLMEDRKTETIRKVPLLGDMPLVGALFRRTSTNKVKTELLIFLTPHVAHHADVLEDMTADEREGIQITPDAVGPGVFQEHMEGMQRGAAPEGSQEQPRGGYHEMPQPTYPSN